MKGYTILKNIEEVVKHIKDNSVKWILLQFTDLAGSLRQTIVSSNVLISKALNGFVGKLDGSSVKGFTSVEKSDLYLKADFSTFALIPWNNGMARIICDVYSSSERFSKDPRYVAQKLDEFLSDQGYRVFVSPELEFFIFDKVRVKIDTHRQYYEIKSSENSWVLETPFNQIKDGYYVPYPRDRFENLKIEIGEILGKYFGLNVEVMHHEVAAASQHEINFRGGSTSYTSDAVQTIKFVIKALAYKKEFTVTFMPKPIHGDNGSGMHIHISLWKDNENLFYDPSDEYACLSQFARYFIGGLLEHGRALSALVSPTVNSYKRLVPGYEAPVYLVWGKGNRSVAIRIPENSIHNNNSIRIEYRPPDPSANPYLALSAVILAGLDGIQKKIDPGAPIEENVYKMSIEKRKTLGIKELPRSLDEALDELESDNEWLKPIFSKDLIESYIELKREEVRKILSYPSPIEILNYIDV